MYLLYLDDYHLDDLLFVQSLGRLMRGTRLPLACVHGSGGEVEKLLEAEGYFPRKVGGAFGPLPPAQRRLVEVGMRRASRTLAARLTDEGVPAVGFHAADRGLVRMESGAASRAPAAWFGPLVATGAVPLVSTLVMEGDGPALAPAHVVLTALAAAVEKAAVVLLTRTGRAGLGTPPLAVADAAAFRQHAGELGDGGVVEPLVEAGVALVATTAPAFFGAQGPAGTRLSA